MPNDYEERKAARIERYEAAAERARARSNALGDESTRMVAATEGQPILIGHHSEKADRRFRERAWNKMGAAVKEGDKAEHYERKAEAAKNSRAISSDDPEAVKKLKEKIARKERLQEGFRLGNRIVKSKPKNVATPEKLKRLVGEVRLTEENAPKLFEPNFCGRIGFSPYILQNNNANIARLKKRLALLEREAGAVTKEEQRDGLTVVENVEENRIQLVFPGKPAENVRAILKESGFRWSHRNMAWQRHLNAAGRMWAGIAVERIAKEA